MMGLRCQTTNERHCVNSFTSFIIWPLHCCCCYYCCCAARMTTKGGVGKGKRRAFPTHARYQVTRANFIHVMYMKNILSLIELDSGVILRFNDYVKIIGKSIKRWYSRFLCVRRGTGKWAVVRRKRMSLETNSGDHNRTYLWHMIN